ncbi:hypothetical protein Q1695_003659 [Nippostrongylus brasiliensis]|nr:hypothetical protein Q1695_003659 [Nippostrongylus brasiliensis]
MASTPPGPSSQKPALPLLKRPQYGCEGEAIKLLVNWYRLECALIGKRIYQYHIVVEQPKRKGKGGAEITRSRRSACFWACVRQNSDCFNSPNTIVFDDIENAFTLSRWELRRNGKRVKSLTFQIKCCETNNKMVNVTVKEACAFYFDIASDDPEAKSRSTALASYLFTQRFRYSPASEDQREIEYIKDFYISSGSIYPIRSDPDRQITVAPGISAWLGAFSALRELQDRNYALNVGLVNRLFYDLELDVLTFYYAVLHEGIKETAENVRKYIQQCGMSRDQMDLMCRRLKDVRLKTTMAIDKRNNLYSFVERHGVFDGLVGYAATKFFFLKDDKPMATIYFNMGAKLTFPYLPPCRLRQDFRNFPQKVGPISYLQLADKPQRYVGMMSDSMRSNYIKSVCRVPNVHKALTDKLVSMLGFSSDPRIASGFLTTVIPKMIECEGRVLPAPTPVDSNQQHVPMTDLREIKRMEVNEAPSGQIIFAVITMEGVNVKEPQRRIFVDDLLKKCRKRGLDVAEDVIWIDAIVELSEKDLDYHVAEVMKIFEQRKKASATINKLLILVFNNKSMFIESLQTSQCSSYGLIKSICDNKYGIPSQVVDLTTLLKAVRSEDKTLFYNIALKVNAKLGGVNQAVIFDDESGSAEVSAKDAVMYVGIDVTHPTQGSGLTDISIASIVANIDLAATKYRCQIMAQMKARETVERFQTQFGQLMIAFHKHSSVWPRHVVIFRDGVSDSEMFTTAFEELECIRKSWKGLTFDDDELEPTYTYIVIQKRHLTRFYYPTEKNGEQTYDNLPSGTVVDKVISSPRVFDFFLASQIGTLGTTRPAHYTVVYDEWSQSPDKIYEMCYRLCFLYARCRRPVSLPCPVYYAHRVCEKAKEVYKLLHSAHRFDDCREEQERKARIEECLSVPDEYPGMHFV